MIIVPGPHGGYWIKDGDKVVLWVWCKERAEQCLKEIEDGK